MNADWIMAEKIFNHLQTIVVNPAKWEDQPQLIKRRFYEMVLLVRKGL